MEPSWTFRLTRYRLLVALLLYPCVVPVSPSLAQTIAPGPGSSSSARGVNVVFILTDDLSMDLLRYMPHVLEMQRQGVTFANYFVTDSLCCPSRSSIFTGRYPHETGIFTNVGPDGGYIAFRDHGYEHATFATALSAVGYRSAILGKYLNGYLPVRDPPAPGWTAWAVAGAAYPEFNYDLNQGGTVVHYGDAPTDYMTDVLSRLGVRFIKEAAEAPFVLEVATFAPHSPYTPAPRDAEALPDVRAPRTPAFDAVPYAAPRWLRVLPALSDADKASIDRDYRKRAQSVLAVDKMIGELQEAVASVGQADHTYFVFSSDNGYHMGEYRLMPGKMTAYDTDIRVPLIVTGPGVPSGRIIEEIVENVDLCPTFAELAGAAGPAAASGHSLVPLLRDQDVAEWRTGALVEHRGPQMATTDPDLPVPRGGNPPTYEAMRTRTSLYVQYADGDEEYHDLTADPDELRNTFSSLPSEQQASLQAALQALKTCTDGKSCWSAKPLRVGARRVVKVPSATSDRGAGRQAVAYRNPTPAHP
jgi:N-acetylglucosamine-6-sulfatase